ncbi:MAG: hypothetical protein IPK35_02760 [Saprospiraceae bacterium]|jgi:hypothetical protein|nr:hypothetical protein [Saprospiraceae bacterium]
MNTSKISLIIHFILGIISIVFGLKYLFSTEFLPYHREAIQMDWTELDSNLQTILLGFMRATAGGLLCSGVLVIVLQYRFYKQKLCWLPVPILLAGLITSLGAVYATALVKFNTTASPPFLLSVLVVLVYILGYFTNKRSINENN